MSRHRFLLAMIAVAGVSLTVAGCVTSLLPEVDVDALLPPIVAYVLDDLSSYVAPADDPFETLEPGTVVDDLAGLDGCWGTAFTGRDDNAPLALVVVYRFFVEDGSFTRWAIAAERGGTVPPRYAILSVEAGSFAMTGDNTVLLTDEHFFSNQDPDTGELTETLFEVEGPADASLLERSALVTLDGDRMMLFIGDETPEDVDADEERPIFFRFSCPLGQ